MAGYSGTPLVRRLGLRDGHRVLVLGRPAQIDLDSYWAPTPALAVLQERATAASAPFDVVLAFCPDRRAVERRLPQAISHVNRTGMVWVAWPKKSGPGYAGPVNGVTDEDVRGAGLRAGLVDVKVCAFDEVWSALKLVYRLADR